MADGKAHARLVVLAGPSAVGKSTVVHRLREEVPNLFFSVSMTTRAPRPGEKEGEDYHFVSPEEFQHRIDAGMMLEWAEIHGGLQRSGTPAQPVLDAQQAGRPVLVEVDIVGAHAIKERLPEAVTVFLAPPTWEELVARLQGRGTETQEVIARRLHTAETEMADRHWFDQVVINDQIDNAVSAISGILLNG